MAISQICHRSVSWSTYIHLDSVHNCHRFHVISNISECYYLVDRTMLFTSILFGIVTNSCLQPSIHITDLNSAENCNIFCASNLLLCVLHLAIGHNCHRSLFVSWSTYIHLDSVHNCHRFNAKHVYSEQKYGKIFTTMVSFDDNSINGTFPKISLKVNNGNGQEGCNNSCSGCHCQPTKPL